MDWRQWPGRVSGEEQPPLLSCFIAAVPSRGPWAPGRSVANHTGQQEAFPFTVHACPSSLLATQFTQVEARGRNEH